MNLDLLRAEIDAYRRTRAADPQRYAQIDAERSQHAAEIRQWSKEEMERLDAEAVYRFIAPLWAMLIWGNKSYVIDKLISENGLDALRTHLSGLIWGGATVATRWDTFREAIKGIGPAMMSEVLCHMRPDTCPIWNRRARAGLIRLEVSGLPKYDYQVTGVRYEAIATTMRVIEGELRAGGFPSADLLAVDYFIWDQLQSDDALGHVPSAIAATDLTPESTASAEAAEFIHNEVRDKLAEIGEWLGFQTKIEVKVADGSKVDAIWQATIGNMGRVVYVFEVQTKGSIDSLILNLLKSLNNPAVQGVVAVSDAKQLERIKKHAADVGGLGSKIKYWDYEEVLRVHTALEAVNESINQLGLVPQGFVF